MHRQRMTTLGVATLWLVGGVTAIAQDGRPATTAAEAFFEAKIRPVLVSHCYQCHSDSAKKTRGGLKLDSRSALLAGGDNGPVIVPGSAEKSLLFKAVSYHDKKLQMPPKGKLPDAVVADFRNRAKRSGQAGQYERGDQHPDVLFSDDREADDQTDHGQDQ